MNHIKPLLHLLLLFLTLSSNIFADGCFVWRWNKKRDITEPSQKALICYKDSIETLVLQVKFSGTASEFGWLVPVPSKPVINALEDNENPFPQLSYYNQKRKNKEEKQLSKSGIGGRNTKKRTVVLEHSFKGVYETAILSSNSSESLQNWLNTHEFNISKEAKTILDDYINRKWLFAAFKIRTAVDTLELQKLKTGELQPISLKFKTDRPVYPMKISSINRGMTDLQIYTLSEGGLRLSPSGSLPQMLEQYEMAEWQKNYRYIKYEKIEHPVVAIKEIPLAFKAAQAETWKNVRMIAYRALILPEEMDGDYWFEFANIKDNSKPLGIYPPDPSELSTETPYEKKLREREEKLEKYKSKYSERRYIHGLRIDPKILDTLAVNSNKYKRELAASCYYTSEKLLKKLSKDKEDMVRIAVAKNYKTSSEILAEMVNDKNNTVHRFVAMHDSTPPEVLLKIVREERLNEKKEPVAASTALYNKSVPIEAINIGLKSKNEYVRIAALSTILTIDKSQLFTLLEDSSSKVRKRLASRKDLDVHFYETLATDNFVKVRQEIAINQSTPYKILNTLITDEDEKVSKYAAQNRTYISRGRKKDVTWSTVLTAENAEKLYNSPNPRTREQVAATATTAEWILNILLKDPIPYVRKALTFNPSTPKEIINKLAKDTSSIVRRSVFQHHNDLNEDLILFIIKNESDSMHLRTIASKTESEKVMNLLSKHDCDLVRMSLATNKLLTKDLQKKLLIDNSPKVRYQFIYKGLSWDDYQKLVKDEDFIISQTSRKKLQKDEEKYWKAIEWINNQK